MSTPNPLSRRATSPRTSPLPSHQSHPTRLASGQAQMAQVQRGAAAAAHVVDRRHHRVGAVHQRRGVLASREVRHAVRWVSPGRGWNGPEKNGSTAYQDRKAIKGRLTSIGLGLQTSPDFQGSPSHSSLVGAHNPKRRTVRGSGPIIPNHTFGTTGRCRGSVRGVLRSTPNCWELLRGAAMSRCRPLSFEGLAMSDRF